MTMSNTRKLKGHGTRRGKNRSAQKGVKRGGSKRKYQKGTQKRGKRCDSASRNRSHV